MRPTLCLGLALLASVVSAQPSFTVVARTGEPAPGTGAFYGQLRGLPTLNAAGQVAFSSTLAGLDVTPADDSAAFTGLPTSIQLLARAGAPAPGADPGTTLIDPFSRAITPDGHVLLESEVSGPTFKTYAYWLGTPGNLRLVAANDPLSPNPTYYVGSIVSTPAVTTGDRGTFVSLQGIHAFSPADPAAPPITDNSNYKGSVINPDGKVAFKTSGGIVYGTPDALQLVAEVDTPAPGTPPGTNFNYLSEPSVNRAGHVAFYAGVGPTTPPPQPDPYDYGALYAGAPGNFKLVARGGDVAPGTNGQLKYAYLQPDPDDYHPPVLSPTGAVAFAATLKTDQDGIVAQGLFAGDGSAAHLVALGGRHAPGLPANIDLQYFRSSAVDINASGQLVFLATVGDPTLFHDNFAAYFNALYAADTDGSLLLLAAVGQPFALAPGDLRTVAQINFHEYQDGTGGEDGRAMAFNDAGQVVFGLTFTDNTSAVILATVPEPVAVAPLALGIVLSLHRTRRRRAS